MEVKEEVITLEEEDDEEIQQLTANGDSGNDISCNSIRTDCNFSFFVLGKFICDSGKINN